MNCHHRLQSLRDKTRAPSVKHRSRAALALALLICATTADSLRAGIPEPDLVWYGKVLTVSGGSTVRLTTGLLTWRIEPVAGGPAWTNSTQLTNLNDQFSFALRLPAETPEPGVAANSNTVSLTTPATSYRRLSVWLDGQPLSIINASNQFSPLPAQRGTTERIDLALGAFPVDSDGDGMTDAWEQQYFGSATGANAGADPDGDGMTNLQEFRAGTHPNNAQSRFAFIDIQPVAGAMRVRWSSQSNKVYRVLRSPVLEAGPPANYQPVQTGIAATPPFNEFLDSTAGGGMQVFYRIQIEE